MRKEVIILSEGRGVFLGECQSNLWSSVNVDGQDVAATFESEADARRFAAGWVGRDYIDDLSYPEIAVAHDGFATLEDLESAGLEAHTALMRAARAARISTCH